MKLLPKQENAVYYLKDNETKETLYGGAAGGGKSAFGVLWLIEMCQTHPGSRWLMGRAKLKALKETTLNTFFELTSNPTPESNALGLIRLGISDQYVFNAQNNIIYFNNGSEILLKDLFLYPSDPNFDSLGSLEVCGAFIDECNQVVYKAWQIVLSRCRYKLTEFNIKPKMFGSCNPAKNWVYKEFYKPHRDGTLPSHRKFIQALPTDNPHLPQSYLDSLLSLDKNSKQRLYYGNWEYDDDPSTLIDTDAIADYFNAEHVKAEGDKYITIDVARKGKDNTVFRVWHGWKCVYRYHIDKSGLMEVVNQGKRLAQKYNIPMSRVIADEDGVGGGVVDFMRCKGFVNNSRALNDENFNNLKSQCGYKMAAKIMKREAGEIASNSAVISITTEEMEQVKQKDIDKDGKVALVSKDVVKQMIGRSPDEWDSIMMRYWFELAPKMVIF